MIITPNQTIRHQGQKLLATVPYTVNAQFGAYVTRMSWAAETPEATPLDDLSGLTVPDGVVDNATGKPVFG